MRGSEYARYKRQTAEIDPYDGHRQHQERMRYPQELCGNYEMPVSFVIGVSSLAIVVMMASLIGRIVSMGWACVVPMVRMPMIFRAVNVNVRNLISGMTVPKRATRVSRGLRVQQQGFAGAERTKSLLPTEQPFPAFGHLCPRDSYSQQGKRDAATVLGARRMLFRACGGAVKANRLLLQKGRQYSPVHDECVLRLA